MAETDKTADAKKLVERDRIRLVDHFKRLYTIVAGLAITEACRKLLPFDPETFSPASFWMFCTFLVTIIPIFQGGDRSLDLKYLDDRKDGTPHSKVAFVWDVVMLIVTALLFVLIAESIPKSEIAPPSTGLSPALPPKLMFFYIMAAFFFFDVCVLIIDYIKTHIAEKLSTYSPWMLMNTILFIVCLMAATFLDLNPKASLSTVAFLTFCCAAARSFFDYRLSGDFMFP